MACSDCSVQVQEVCHDLAVNTYVDCNLSKRIHSHIFVSG